MHFFGNDLLLAQIQVNPDKYYRNNLEVFSNMNIAIIIENPTDIVVPYLVKEEDFSYSSEPFSTVEAAIKWIL